MTRKLEHVKNLSIRLLKQLGARYPSRLKRVRQIHSVSSIKFMGAEGRYERTETIADMLPHAGHHERAAIDDDRV